MFVNEIEIKNKNKSTLQLNKPAGILSETIFFVNTLKDFNKN